MGRRILIFDEHNAVVKDDLPWPGTRDDGETRDAAEKESKEQSKEAVKPQSAPASNVEGRWLPRIKRIKTTKKMLLRSRNRQFGTKVLIFCQTFLPSRHY